MSEQSYRDAAGKTGSVGGSLAVKKCGGEQRYTSLTHPVEQDVMHGLS